MKYLLPAIAVFVLSLTACGESSSDEPLPDGAAPNPADNNRELLPTPADGQPSTPDVDSSDEPADQTDSEPETTDTPPPLPLPVPADDAERSKAPGLSYILPKEWTVGPAKQMRLLTLLPPDAPGADLAISRWPGDVGGFASNVARWVRQAGLPPIPGLMTAAASDFEKFKVGDTTATWIPLMNEDTNVAILAVWVPRGDEPENPTETWTFKLTCKADQVQSLAPAVRAFCESVKFE